jgi:hypothetical protein
VFRRYVAVGRDYEGRSIMALDEYQALEAQLNDACPERFAEPSKQQHPEFASTYFRFLEACIARCAHDARFESDNPAVGESIDELLTVLAGAAYEVVCCRHVSHLTTTNGDECRIQGVTVVPEQSDSGIRRELIRRNLDEIPGAARLGTGKTLGPTIHQSPHRRLGLAVKLPYCLRFELAPALESTAGSDPGWGGVSSARTSLSGPYGAQ